MLLYVDKENCIMAVNSTDRTDLTEIKVDESNEFFQFAGWSETRICCYKISYHYPQIDIKEETITNPETNETETIEVPVYSEYATITMITPYVPTHMMSALDNLEKRSTNLEATNEELTVANEELAMTMDVLLTELIPSLMESE